MIIKYLFGSNSHSDQGHPRAIILNNKKGSYQITLFSIVELLNENGVDVQKIEKILYYCEKYGGAYLDLSEKDILKYNKDSVLNLMIIMKSDDSRNTNYMEMILQRLSNLEFLFHKFLQKSEENNNNEKMFDTNEYTSPEKYSKPSNNDFTIDKLIHQNSNKKSKDDNDSRSHKELQVTASWLVFVLHLLSKPFWAIQSERHYS